MRKYTVLDLFCGAGGLSLGFCLTNRFEIIGAIDHWQPAIDTFKYNHCELNPEKVICGDITRVFDDDFQKEIQNLYGSPDIIVGGPPCQGMSLAGKRLDNDPRNQLFKSFVKTVDVLRPTMFLMENVPGLLTAEGGKIHKAVISAFEEIGYNHFFSHPPLVLKAENYGVPQMRRRLFFIGVRSDIEKTFENWPPKATFSPDDLSEASLFDERDNDTQPFVNVRAAISDLPQIHSGEGAEVMEYPLDAVLSDFQRQMRDWDKALNKSIKPAVYNHEAPNHTQKLIEMIKNTSPGKSVDPKYTDSKMWDPNKIGYTVKALGAGGGSTNRRAFHYNPETPRGSTVRENARIQSFPDWYVFTGSKTDQMTQVGNAVPPLLAKAIANVVADYLDGVGDR